MKTMGHRCERIGPLLRPVGSRGFSRSFFSVYLFTGAGPRMSALFVRIRYLCDILVLAKNGARSSSFERGDAMVLQFELFCELILHCNLRCGIIWENDF